MINYETLKATAKEMKTTVNNLIVLAPQNDPFYCGKEMEQEKAVWFANLWKKYGYSQGVHLRRIHYQFISESDPKKHDGSVYQNTDKDWRYLCESAKYARYLGLIDIEAFDDRRNPDPHIFAIYPLYNDDIRGWEMDKPNWNIPYIPTDVSFSLPTAEVNGYSYNIGEQLFHLEVCCEKSTMNDVLIPICRKYNINLVTAIGEMSITQLYNLVKRVEAVNKPARIFYLSDYDPAGYGMPTAASRKIEFLAQGKDVDIKLHPILLTREQVRHFALPRTPIKEKELRKNNFEEIHGRGAVELDALEARHPGELAYLLEKEITAYRDLEIQERIEDAGDEAEDIVDEKFKEAMEPYLEELEEIRSGIKSVIERYKSFNDEMEPYRERAERILYEMEQEAEELDIPLPERPYSTLCEPNTRTFLFDTKRDYETQLHIYKQHKNATELST